MKFHGFTPVLVLLITIGTSAVSDFDISTSAAATLHATDTKTTTKKKGGGNSKSNPTGKKTTNGTRKRKNNSAAKRNRKNNKKNLQSTSDVSKNKQTSADIKRQQEATQREISETKRQIKANDINIKKGVEELGRLQGDIGNSRRIVEQTTTEVAALSEKIATLQQRVDKEEMQLETIRAEYLKAIKKMRRVGKKNSTLAFLFSSDSFNQALRRMRYLKQFSEWKERKSSEITERVAHLKKEQQLLADSRREKDTALKRQGKAQKELESQYARQNLLVTQLKANGEALHRHLSQKQAEANTLKGRVAALIAAEQQALEETRRKEELRKEKLREEEARKEQQRLAEEQLALQKEKHSVSAPPQLAQEIREAPSKANSTDEKKNAGKKQKNSKIEQSKKTVQQAEVRQSNNYANARKRKPRGEKSATATPKNRETSSPDPGFEKMRGALPKPVAGTFKITSPFGRHSLPELPGVMYDNPGIDAQVTAGAPVMAVYGGKVSGVYMIPGFSTVVIVNHGNYYTVYGNIASPSVKVGDKIKQGQTLGKLILDEDDSTHSSLHFEVWKNREKLNPTDWIN